MKLFPPEGCQLMGGGVGKHPVLYCWATNKEGGMGWGVVLWVPTTEVLVLV